MSILVPVDFSPNTETAIRYASELSRRMHTNLHLVHVVPPTPIVNSVVRVGVDAIRENAIFKLSALARHIHQDYNLNSSYEVRIGHVGEQVAGAALSQKTALIVLSTFGTSPIKRFINGSHAHPIVENSPVPVLIIPEACKFQPFKRIVFATDYHASDLGVLLELSKLARTFGATVKSVHIVNRFEEEEDDAEIGVVRYFSSLVEKQVPDMSIRCEEYQHTDVAEGIRCYAEDEKADLLALSIGQRTFLERLFNESVSEVFIFEITMPLIIYHGHRNGRK